VDGFDVVDGFSDFPPAGMLPADGGGGSDLPQAGISPAKIEVESAHMSASAIANRFMDFAPFEVEKMPKFLHKKEWNNNAGFVARQVRAN